jgi:DNA-binding MarR family transcriptional regulator/RimJ/RimL family protein N-acetyltransferase
VRVLYELANRDRPTATDLGKDLNLDPGYLSRILRGFERRGLLASMPSATDGRQHLLSLTARGRRAFAPLDVRQRDEIRSMLARLSDDGQRRLVDAMQTIERLLDAGPAARGPYLLRPPHPGDLGWVVHRHGALYAEEHGWDERFEAQVAEFVAGFVRDLDPRRERCWMAELDGETIGCVFVTRRDGDAAQLHLLLVEPKARGMGIGTRLVGECMRFAQQAGYRKINARTHAGQYAARRILERTGFRLVRADPSRAYGRDLVKETWEWRRAISPQGTWTSKRSRADRDVPRQVAHARVPLRGPGGAASGTDNRRRRGQQIAQSAGRGGVALDLGGQRAPGGDRHRRPARRLGPV